MKKNEEENVFYSMNILLNPDIRIIYFLKVLKKTMQWKPLMQQVK